MAFQGLNNNLCVVKRYDFDNAESFQNINDSCSKNIYKNLVVNGYGEYGDNTNFSGFTYNPSTNDFKTDASTYTIRLSDIYMPINYNRKYIYKADMYSNFTETFNYAGYVPYDIDKMTIDAHKIMYIPNTLTTLARDLKDGDTVVYLNDLSNWYVTAEIPDYYRGFIFWNYRDSTGYQYPELTYSQNVWLDLFTYDKVNKTNNTITLNSPWSHGTFKAGTKLSQSNAGTTYSYGLLKQERLTSTYKTYSNTITGVGDGNDTVFSHEDPHIPNLFRYPVKYATMFFLYNETCLSSNQPYMYVKNVIFEEID